MLSLDNAYNEDELRAFDERVRKGAGLGDQPRRLRRRAEDRRPEHRADLRGRPARARRDARRRRRGEDVTANVRTIRAVPLRLRGGPAGPDRSARRGLSAARGVRADEPRARGGRRAAVREPAERRRRHDAQSGSGARRRSAGWRRSSISWSTPGGVEADAPAATHADMLDRAARVGPAGRAALAALRGIDE